MRTQTPLSAWLVEHADILAVQEVTPEKADVISAAGLDEIFPFQVLRAWDGPAGVGIWSRYPMETRDRDDDFWLGLVTARVRIPGVHGGSDGRDHPHVGALAGADRGLARRPGPAGDCAARRLGGSANGAVMVAG